MTEPKVVVACRIVPELKAQLEDEAAERGETLSSYMDLLITHREHIFDDTDDTTEFDDEHIEAAREYISQLENENTELKIEVNRLLSHVTITNRDLNDKPTEKAATPQILSEPYKKAVLENLEKISQKHRDYSPEQLLLASTGLALENGTFTVYNLKDYLKKNKQYYPPINTQKAAL